MSTFTFEQLTKPITRTQAAETIYELLQDLGYDLTLFVPGSPGANFVMAAAELLLSGNITGRSIASGTLSDYAKDEYLTRLSSGHFGNDKKLATFTEGIFAFTGSNPNLYQVVPAGGIAISDGTRRFITQEQIIVQSGSIVTASVRGENPGAAWNIPNNSSLNIQQDIDGLTVTNGPISGSNTWITTSGVNEESEKTLRKRNSTKWATHGNTTESWIIAHLLASGTSTTKIKVITRPELGPGFVDIPVSADISSVGSDEINELQGFVTSSILFGNSGSVIIKEAPLFGSDISGTLYFSKDYQKSVVKSQVETDLNQFHIDMEMGGFDLTPSSSNVVPVESIDKVITNVPGVVSWDRVLPSHDIYLPISGVLVPGSSSFNNITYTKLTNK